MLIVEKIGGHKRKLQLIIKHALFPVGTTSLLVSCSGLWGVCVQIFIKHVNFFTTSSWWHDITSSKVSCVSNIFLIFWNYNAMSLHTSYRCVHAVRQICLKIPSNLLHMELTRTQVHKIWFFKPLWLAVAFRCSSNLNSGH